MNKGWIRPQRMDDGEQVETQVPRTSLPLDLYFAQEKLKRSLC